MDFQRWKSLYLLQTRLEEMDTIMGFIVMATAVIFFSGVALFLAISVLMPVLSVCALPIYAAMIAVEIGFASYFHQSQLCKPLTFHRPRSLWKKLQMDLSASACTFIGTRLLATVLAHTISIPNMVQPIFIKLTIEHDAMIVALSICFWFLLVLTYLVSICCKDDHEHPFNKLEALRLSEFNTSAFGIFTQRFHTKALSSGGYQNA